MTASMRFLVLSALCVISVVDSAAPKFKLKPVVVDNIQDPTVVKQINTPSSQALQSKPANTVVYAGENATLYCSSQPGSGARIQWWEWTTSSTPQLISDQDLLTRHPNGDKYQIEQPNSYTYNLVIRDVQLTDVGTYTCLDSAFGPPCTNVSAEQAGNIASADLIVLTSAPECDTTISPSGSVFEDAYHTAECVMYFRGKVLPTITWTGPSPFAVFRQSTPTYAWSGIELNATRYMENLAFTAVSKFESSDPSSNFSDSAPIWNYTYHTPTLNVSWGPKNLNVVPVKEFYHVGDVIRCYADAKPGATYVWQNMQNGDRFNTQTFTVTANMLDNTWTLRCQAMNNILGTVYSANVAVTVTVVTNTDTTAAEPQHSTEQTTEYLPTTVTQENNSSGHPCETWFYDYEGEVVSYNYPWGYPAQYSYCNYYIYVYQSTPLTFTFNSPVEIGNNGYYGYVEIYSSYTGERYTFSNFNSPPAPIYFSYNYHGTIQITYYSQSPYPEVGFSLNYTRASGGITTEEPHELTTRSVSGSPCGSSFYDREGNITSENYPWGDSPYYPPHYSYCYYYLYVHQATPITFTFTPPFGIRNTGGYNGYLEFYSTNNGLRYRVDGYSTPSPIYFGYDYYWEIQITYYSNSPFQEEGFSLFYIFDSASADCGQTNFIDPEGFLSSPNYPNPYPDYSMCIYSIQLDQISNISLEFLNPFWLESCCDWVKIFLDPNSCRGISSEIVYTFTGSTTPEPLMVDSCSALRVEFRSDSSITGAGFGLRYIAENTSILMMRNDYDGSQSYFFNRPWAEYKDGFGNLTSLYWIGLDRLHEVSQYGCRIRFDIQHLNSRIWYFIEYSNFSVAGSSDNYRLSINGYSGNIYDGMENHDGQQFSTYDMDNDQSSDNCATSWGGGFWFNNCFYVLLTGSPYHGFQWYDYLQFCEVRMWC